MVRWLAGSFATAVVMYAWGFLWWGVLPFGGMMTTPLPNEPVVRQAIAANLGITGVYVTPAMSEMSEEPGRASMFNQPPLTYLYFRAEPASPLSFRVLGLGFLHGLVAALIAGYLLAAAMAALGSYAKRVLFVFVLGLFANFTMHIGDVIWLQQPGFYHGLAFAYGLVNWLLAGLVLAAIIKPEPESVA